ncbi:hypothetical protein X777_00344 [Ooceraea biroi]|uniref:Uncharacterized protein n=1 Tax=Ooceraea biroi TaxID=2015173 RepID=A0A026WV13_OOCBI|nr:hypothetical protein X777_00344 [Ooceraea biroi]
MGHRSQRPGGGGGGSGGGGGHCLNLSPRIEVCLLTCIPSRGALEGDHSGPAGPCGPRPGTFLGSFPGNIHRSAF